MFWKKDINVEVPDVSHMIDGYVFVISPKLLASKKGEKNVKSKAKAKAKAKTKAKAKAKSKSKANTKAKVKAKAKVTTSDVKATYNLLILFPTRVPQLIQIKNQTW